MSKRVTDLSAEEYAAAKRDVIRDEKQPASQARTPAETLALSKKDYEASKAKILK